MLFFSGVGEGVCVGVHTVCGTRYTRALNIEAWEEERLFQFYFEIVFWRQNRLKWQLFIWKSDCRLESPCVTLCRGMTLVRSHGLKHRLLHGLRAHPLFLLCVVLGVVSFWDALGFAFCMFTP